MKYCYPDYYPQFSCISKDCRHNCCIGWEIDIDDDTFDYYQSLGGKIGNLLRENIEETNGVPHFCLTGEEKCPFLNQQGLCDLITQLGENSLCQICTDHPRFRSFFSDREEIGLGLCCEEAGRIILNRKEPVFLLTEETEEPEGLLTPDEKELLSLRCSLIQLMQNRSLTFEERILKLSGYCMVTPPAMDYRRWSQFFLSLERMDDQWTRLLQTLAHAQKPVFAGNTKWDLPFEQLCVYLLYRHLPSALEDGLVIERVVFAGVISGLLGCLCALEENCTMEKLIDYARLYSAEIEYSDCNLKEILLEIQKYLHTSL